MEVFISIFSTAFRFALKQLSWLFEQVICFVLFLQSSQLLKETQSYILKNNLRKKNSKNKSHTLILEGQHTELSLTPSVLSWKFTLKWRFQFPC